MQKGSGSILSYISSKTSALPPAKNDLVDLWPNLWCNNSKSIFFLSGDFFFFGISLIFPRNACFLCALCGKVTTLFSFATNYTMQNHLRKKQVCPEFINIVIKNNLSHKSGVKITLCNVAIKASPLSSHILFVLDIFVFLWHDVSLKLQCIYPYLIMNLEWNLKLLVSYGTLLRNIKSNWSIANCHHTFHLNICPC